MKKIVIMFMLLFVALSSVWSDDTVYPSKEYRDIPIELRGVWYSTYFSSDEGKTGDHTYRPFMSVTQFFMSTAYSSERIVYTQLYKHKLGPSYLLFTEVEGVQYLVVFLKDHRNEPVVYKYNNRQEQFRCCIRIVKI